MDNLSLAELSERAGVPPRTIRFYIAQGLLPGPRRSGRSAVYGNAHLRLLDRIKGLQAKGMTLAEVAFALLPSHSHRDLPQPVAWLEYDLSDEVVVRVRSGIAPWRHKLIRNVLAEAATKLQDEQKERETK
ncbi:MAG: MerR family transcriptional regulator [Acidobacteriaceae bacterium]|nr:MerR family transcriptional regulator [Acidobacteriaceae bacterium]